MAPSCPRLWEVEAIGDGRLSPKDVAAAQRHARVCATCAAAHAELAEIRERAAAALSREPDPLALRRVRARVLRDAARPPRRVLAVGRAASAVACLLVVAAAVALWVPLRSAAPSAAAQAQESTEFAGTVAAEEGAVWSQVRKAPREEVRLRSGTLHVHVRHQQPGERFLVLVPDGEIEARGTSFDVTASASRVERVHVTEGAVALRVGSQDEVLVPADGTWTAPSSVVDSPRAPAPQADSIARATVVARPRSQAPAAAAPRPPRDDDDDGSYAEAVRLMATQRWAEAAAALGRFLAAHPTDSRAEDASFLEAVALAREGRTDAAGAMAERHLDQFPSSFHRKDALTLVARAARNRGDCSGARRALAPWLAAADPVALAELRTCAEEPAP